MARRKSKRRKPKKQQDPTPPQGMRRNPKNQCILELNEDVLHLIIQQLSAPAAACLALTCHGFYDLVIDVFKRPLSDFWRVFACQLVDDEVWDWLIKALRYWKGIHTDRRCFECHIFWAGPYGQYKLCRKCARIYRGLRRKNTVQ